MNMEKIASIASRKGMQSPVRVCLGQGAPQGLSDFIERAGIDVLPYSQKHLASLYVDFIGARPPGVEVLAIDLGTQNTGSPQRASADLTTNNWHTAGCLIISHALGLKPPLLSADPEMLLVIKTALGVAKSQVPVLLSGEIGAGKCNIARLIHHAGTSRAPFTIVSCAGLQDVDVERLPGAMLSDSGHSSGPAATLYLDEIAELCDAAQLKLLDLLRAVEIQPSQAAGGGAMPGARIISATNRSFPTMVERGEFRRDLYWRLNIFAIQVPALRERVGDVAMLARYFLRRANSRRSFTPMALKTLAGYAFPGNVLELESLVTRLAISPLVTGASFIDVADIRRHLVIAHGTDATPASGWKSSREEARREMILSTIAAAGGNRLQAARRLGITLRALQYHITKAGLSRRRRPRVTQAIAAATIATPPAQTPVFSFVAEAPDPQAVESGLAI